MAITCLTCCSRGKGFFRVVVLRLGSGLRLLAPSSNSLTIARDVFGRKHVLQDGGSQRPRRSRCRGCQVLRKRVIRVSTAIIQGSLQVAPQPPWEIRGPKWPGLEAKVINPYPWELGRSKSPAKTRRSANLDEQGANRAEMGQGISAVMCGSA